MNILITMDSKFSNKIKEVITYSREEAIRLGSTSIGTEHLFLGILRDGESLAVDILNSLGVDLSELKKTLEQRLAAEKPAQVVSDKDDITLYKSAERVLKLVYLEARALKNETVNTAHLLLAILKDENSIVTQVLSEKNVDYMSIRSILNKTRLKQKPISPMKTMKDLNLEVLLKEILQDKVNQHPTLLFWIISALI